MKLATLDAATTQNIILILGALGTLVMSIIAALKATQAKTQSDANAANHTALASQVATNAANTNAQINAVALATPPPATATVAKTAGLVILPLMLICLMGSGCATTDPQLDAYREGLHSVDEPLYQAHTQLMADAVKAGLRTANDQAVVAAGIAESEALYQQSRKTEATHITPGTPTLVLPTTFPATTQ